MEQIIITHVDGSTLKLLSKENNSRPTRIEQNVELLSNDTIDITVESSKKLGLYVGDKINVFGRDYTLNLPAKERKISESHFVYDMQFEGVQYDLLRCQYNVNIDTTGSIIQDLNGASLTGDIKMFLDVLVANANRIYPNKWSVGNYPANTETKTLTFGDSDTCLSVLQSLCSEDNYNTEFKIDIDEVGHRTIHIGQTGTTFGYTFKYGRGKGLYELTREKVSSSNIINRLFVYGSSKNIVTTKYRADRLCLPTKSKGNSYIENAASIAKYGVWEGTKQFEEVFPHRTGTITALGDSVYKFADAQMSFDLNERDGQGVTKYLMAGQSAKVHFNTGKLAGYEFELHAYDHATKTFTIVKQTDENDYSFPSETLSAFQFSVGDQYVLTDIYQPQVYIDAAESELNVKGTNYLLKYCNPLIQYGLSIDNMFIKTYVNNNGTNVFWVGDLIPVEDTDMDINRAIRITGFTRNLINEFDYKLTVSDIPVEVSTIVRTITDVKGLNNVVKINRLADPARARQNYKASQEVLSMVFDDDGYFTDKIRPLSIETSMLSVGAKWQQFGMNNTLFNPNYNGAKNRIVYKGGTLAHYTINNDNGTPKSWTIADGDVTLGSDVAYYIYAKCSKTTTSGIIVFDTQQILPDSDANYYHFLIGVANSVDGTTNTRLITLTYGGTTINGRYIKTGRIVSNDGTTYFDLDTGEFRGSFTFTNGDSVQTAISNKNRNFTSQPGTNDAYSVGDTWTNATYGTTYRNDILRCKTAKAAGAAFDIAHWELATKYTDDTVANAAITASNNAQAAATTALQSANAANSSIFDQRNYIDGAFKDGVVSEAEAAAIDKLNKQINSEFDRAIADYNSVYTNSYLVGAAKSDLLNSKINLVAAKDALQTSINNAIADGKTTAAEKADVDSKFATYKNAFTDYQTKLSNAGKAVQVELDRLAGVKVDGLQIGGRNIAKNTDVKKDVISTYSKWAGSEVISQSVGNYIYCGGSITNAGIITPTFYADIKNGVKYTISLYTSSYYNIDSLNYVYILSPSGNKLLPDIAVDGSTTDFKFASISFVADKDYVSPQLLLAYNKTAGVERGFRFHSLKVESGDKSTDWTPAPEDVQASIDEAKLSAANAQADATLAKQRTEGRTVIEGGVVETNIVTLGTGGIAGMSGIPTDSSNNPLPSRWAGGTYSQAIAKTATIIEWFNGDAKYGDLWIDGNGSIYIKDSTKVSRVLMTKNNITTLASISSSTQNYTVNNAAKARNSAGTEIYTLPNQFIVQNNNSTLTITCSISASVTAMGLNASGSASIDLYLVNVGTSEETFIDTVGAYCNGEADSASVQINRTFTVPAGTYALKIIMVNANINNCGTFSGISGSTTIIFFDGSTQRTELGKNGLGIIGNATNYSFFGMEDGIFKAVEKVSSANIYDKPGVLATGSVSSGATQTNKWGAKVATYQQSISKGGTGVYIIPHNIGSGIFTAIVTPTTDNINCRVTAKTSTTFTVSCKNMSSTATDASFDYILLGNNQ